MYFRYKTVFFITSLITFAINASQDNLKSPPITDIKSIMQEIEQAISSRDIKLIISQYALSAIENNRMPGPPGDNNKIAFSNNGKYLAQISSLDKSFLEIFNTESKNKKITKLFDSSLTSLAFSPDDKYLAIAKTGYISHGNIIILDVDENSKSFGNELNTFKAHEYIINSLLFSHDLNSYYLASGSEDKKIKIWDFSAALSKQSEDKMLLSLYDNKFKIKDMSLSHDGKFLASGSIFNITIWDFDIHSKTNGQVIKKISDKDLLIALKYSPNGKFLAAAFWEFIKVWDSKNYDILHSIKISVTGLSSMDFSRDNLYLISGSYDTKVQIIDANTFKPLIVLDNYNHQVTSVAFCSIENKINEDGKAIVNNKYLASVAASDHFSGDSLIIIWRLSEFNFD